MIPSQTLPLSKGGAVMAMKPCPYCGFPNIEERSICKACKQDMRLEVAPVSTTPLPPAELSRLLEAEIVRQQAAGWRLQTRTETTAQLVREVSNTNGCLLIILLCLAIIPGILYAAFAKRTSSLYITIDSYGRIQRVLDGVSATPPPAPVVASSGGGPTVEQRLAQIDSLKARGVLTDEEYAERRQRILSSL